MAAERMGEITGGNGNEHRKEEEREEGMIQFGEEGKKKESILPLCHCHAKQQLE